MKISGLQKLSMLDYPGKIAATVFTGGCNMRCPFCHNAELLDNPPEAMKTEELLAFLEKRKGMIDGVCVTGGEPCIHKDLPDLFAAIREIGLSVKLDTNGTFPELLQEILDRKLIDYAAIDVKNSEDRYAETAGLKAFAKERYLTSIEALMDSGIDYELRTTVVKPFHDEASFAGIRDMLLPLTEKHGKKIAAYYLQPFVDRDTVVWSGLGAPTEEELKIYADILRPVAAGVSLRGV